MLLSENPVYSSVYSVGTVAIYMFLLTTRRDDIDDASWCVLTTRRDVCVDDASCADDASCRRRVVC